MEPEHECDCEPNYDLPLKSLRWIIAAGAGFLVEHFLEKAFDRIMASHQKTEVEA